MTPTAPKTLLYPTLDALKQALAGMKEPPAFRWVRAQLANPPGYCNDTHAFSDRERMLAYVALREREQAAGWHFNKRYGYLPPLEGWELKERLNNAGGIASLNHLITDVYPIAMMPREHKVMLWCRAKQLGADWDKQEGRFVERKQETK